MFLSSLMKIKSGSLYQITALFATQPCSACSFCNSSNAAAWRPLAEPWGGNAALLSSVPMLDKKALSMLSLSHG